MSDTVELSYPLTVDGVEVSAVKLRRATVNDLEEVESEKSNLLKTKKLVVLLTGLPPDEVGNMDAADFATLGDKVADFLG